jgi:hypothetical protein
MCDLCDQPELTMDAYVALVRERLTYKRFVLQSVTGSRDRAEFTYSVGLTAHALPELIVLGVRPADAGRLVELWGDYLLDESLVLPGERLTSGPFVMEAIEVQRPQDHLVLAGVIYGPAVRALQLTWADGGGRWPWEAGHRARRAGQPLLGERAPIYCHEHKPDRLDVPPHL